jgi:hypothetical protein
VDGEVVVGSERARGWRLKWRFRIFFKIVGLEGAIRLDYIGSEV